MDFAKIFNHRTIGQVLVTTESEDGPKLKIRINDDGLDIAVSIDIEDTEKGWDKLKNLFNEMTEEKAFGVAENIYNELY